MRRVAILLALGSLGCWLYPPPGETEKAKRGYRRAEPVIVALGRFKADSGYYPDSLLQLLPRYLAAGALAIPDAEGERYPLEYQRSDSTFGLSFQYAGPGIAECLFRPGYGWECSGAF